MVWISLNVHTRILLNGSAAVDTLRVDVTTVLDAREYDIPALHYKYKKDTAAAISSGYMDCSQCSATMMVTLLMLPTLPMLLPACRPPLLHHPERSLRKKRDATDGGQRNTMVQMMHIMNIKPRTLS